MNIERIRLYCMTERGVAVYRELRKLCDLWSGRHVRIDVVSAEPAKCEPDFIPNLQAAVEDAGDELLMRADLASSFKEPQLAIACNWRWKLQAPRDGSLYILHDSLLPRNRGFSPLVHALRQGERITGATLFRAVDAIDAGPIVMQQRVHLGPEIGIAAAMAKMQKAYLHILRTVVPIWLAGHDIMVYGQDHNAATYCRRIDWQTDTEIQPSWDEPRVANHVRAFQPPYPQAWIRVGERPVRVASLKGWKLAKEGLVPDEGGALG